MILPRVGVPAEAEDVLRETFLTLLEKVDRYTWRGVGLYGWLRRVAINKIIGEEDVMNAQTLPKVKMPNRDNFIIRFPDRI